MRSALVLVLAAAASLAGTPSRAGVASLPEDFQDSVSIEGLSYPTNFAFAPDGRVFVAEYGGLVKVFADLGDTTPDVFADLSASVLAHWDRGLLGLAIDPAFPESPYVYVLYSLDANPVGSPAQWGDTCPTPPGYTTDGCPANARLARLQVGAGNALVGGEQVLLEGHWCQQFPSHSIGTVTFGGDGALYVGAGDGASFLAADWGQFGGSLPGTPTPVNPCGDPSFEGGALRSQDLRTTGDPVSYDGAILRLDPATGAALPTNPLYGGESALDDRIIAYGLRNPYRFAARPGTTQLWIGDVGWEAQEEVNRILDPTDATVENFGWPCYEGTSRNGPYENADLPLCQSLYGTGQATPPYYHYDHSSPPGAPQCSGSNGSSLAGLAFYEGGEYPRTYEGALFFTDSSIRCLWAMRADANGTPVPANVEAFGTDLPARPVDLEIGPAGDLFYLAFDEGAVHRIRYFPVNEPPTAVIAAEPRFGLLPLAVDFDASGSSDPDAGDLVAFAWDLDDDGAFDDAMSVTSSRLFETAGTHVVRLRVTDALGAASVDTVEIQAGNTPPVATIVAPQVLDTWIVGDEIALEGTATDTQEAALGAAAFSWQVIVRHCPDLCHDHLLDGFEGTRTAAFFAPDHEYPTSLRIVLTVTDAGGLEGTDEVELLAEHVTLTIDSVPQGLEIDGGAAARAARAVTPHAFEAVVGSRNEVVAEPFEVQGGTTWAFASWSDGGAPRHYVTATAGPVTLTATYVPAGTVPIFADGFEGGPVLIWPGAHGA